MEREIPSHPDLEAEEHQDPAAARRAFGNISPPPVAVKCKFFAVF
jgi:hypothetical protein